MFVWKPKFDTGIDRIDDQHRRLVDVLNELYAAIDHDAVDESVLDTKLQALIDYAHYHFVDEEALMEAKGVAPEHIKLHRMEHHAFLYDVQRLRAMRSSAEDMQHLATKTTSFVTTWLAMHILGIDQSLARQIRDIEAGTDAATALEHHKDWSYDPGTTRALVRTLLDMWRDAEDRYEALRARP